MSPRDANPVVTRVKTAAGAEASAKCLTLFAPPAAEVARSLFSPEMTAPFTAAIVFQTKGKHKITPSGVFLCPKCFGFALSA